jgi:hypothetical protein
MNKANAFRAMAVVVLGLFQSASAQQPDVAQGENVETQLQRVSTDVNNLQRDVDRLRLDVREVARSGTALFLFGIVCALWAQNTGRNPWLWFFLGLFFSVITGLVLLSKNSQDRKLVPKGN